VVDSARSENRDPDPREARNFTSTLPKRIVKQNGLKKTQIELCELRQLLCPINLIGGTGGGANALSKIVWDW
jgi:hypothetical protein